MIIDPVGPTSRLGIYFFYDADGVVDDYVVHFLRELNSNLSELIVVCNGKLTAEGRARLSSIDGAQVIVRPNKGFDVWAYKAALDSKGWEALAEYDEVIMVNFTIMGPTHPFETMFSEMDSRDLDFWGITVHNGATFDPWGTMEDGYIPLHLQSHFIAVRRSMLIGTEFQSYWDNMVPIESYGDAVSKHEAIFTKRFSDAGFRWSAFVDTADLVGKVYYPLFNMPVDLIENRGCPIFKRKSFFADPTVYLDENANQPARQLIDYLHDSGRYDSALVYRHLARSSNQYDLRMALNLDEVLSSAPVARSESHARTAVFVNGAARDAELWLEQARLSATDADIFLLLGEDAEIEGQVEPSARTLSPLVRVVDTRDGSALHMAVELSQDYEFACFVDAERDQPTFPESIQYAQRDQAREAVLASQGYVSNVIDFFETHDSCGMLVPPPPVHAGYFGSLGLDWTDDFEPVVGTLEALGLTVPVSPEKPPVVPISGVFWFRTSALARLIDLAQNSTSGTALTTGQWRLLLPLVVQGAGYFVHYSMPENVARNRLTNMTHYLEALNRRIGSGVGDRFSTVDVRMSELARLSAVYSPAQLVVSVYWDRGEGFGEGDKLSLPYDQAGVLPGGVAVEFVVPAGVVGMRVDPVEGLGCACRDVRLEGGAGLILEGVNSMTALGFDVFGGDDPQYLVRGEVAEGQKLRLTIGEFHVLPGEDSLIKLLGGALAEVEEIRWSKSGRLAHKLRAARKRLRRTR
ncbi:rhamnan synthesis F family protein [Leifsonia sp. YAF41]|uniref:rhamnan synthesis F family protein n=1 Tax=Leifsonia sp. YAF41 TaxID=3233086 RepID=UPI003F9C176A